VSYVDLFLEVGDLMATILLDKEVAFQQWYKKYALKLGLNLNPDDPKHYYDYRAAFAAGAKPDKSGHWPSEYKLPGHPRLILKGIDTRTGKPVKK